MLWVKGKWPSNYWMLSCTVDGTIAELLNYSLWIEVMNSPMHIFVCLDPK